MRPKVITQTGVGLSRPFVVNYRQNAFRISVSTNVTGTATYTIQHTFDDPNNFTDANDYNTNANWFDIDLTDMVGATTDQDGNYFFPVRAVRTNVTAGTGSVATTLIQGNAN